MISHFRGHFDQLPIISFLKFCKLTLWGVKILLQNGEFVDTLLPVKKNSEKLRSGADFMGLQTRLKVKTQVESVCYWLEKRHPTNIVCIISSQ